MGASIVDYPTGCLHILPAPSFGDGPWCSRLEDANAAEGRERYRWYRVEFHRGGTN